MVVAGVGVGMFIERRMTEEMDNWGKNENNGLYQTGLHDDDDSTYSFCIRSKPPAP